MTVSLELTLGTAGVSGTLRLGGRGGGPRVIACRASIWDVAHQRPEQGCSCHAYLPTHFGSRSEAGPRGPAGAVLSQVTGNRQGSWTGHKAHGCQGSCEGRLKGDNERRPSPALQAGAPNSPPGPDLPVGATCSLTSLVSAEGQACPAPVSRMKGKLLPEGRPSTGEGLFPFKGLRL